jgi:peptide/nickel transport system substrate-binding protein
MSKPKSNRTIMLAGLVAALIVLAVAAFFLLGPKQPKYKDTIVIGTTDSVQTTLDPCEAYDYLGVNIIQNMGEGLFGYEPCLLAGKKNLKL